MRNLIRARRLLVVVSIMAGVALLAAACTPNEMPPNHVQNLVEPETESPVEIGLRSDVQGAPADVSAEALGDSFGSWHYNGTGTRWRTFSTNFGLTVGVEMYLSTQDSFRLAAVVSAIGDTALLLTTMAKFLGPVITFILAVLGGELALWGSTMATWLSFGYCTRFRAWINPGPSFLFGAVPYAPCVA